LTRGLILGLPKPSIGLWTLISCVAIWSVNAVALREATQVGVGIDPIALTCLRFLVVGPIFAIGLALKDKNALKLDRKSIGVYLIFGLVSIVFGETMQTLALRYTSVANLTLLSHGTIALFTALWAQILYKEKITRWGWIGAGVAMVGVGVIAMHSAGGLRFDSESWKGDALALLRSIIHSCYLLYMSRWMQAGRSPIATTTYICLFGSLWCLPFALPNLIAFDWSHASTRFYLAVFWTVVPTTLYGFLAWNAAMKKVGAQAATNLMYFMPLASALTAWLLIGQVPTLWHAIGGVIILGGVMLLRRKPG
jgi:drug/metabolite transporter (DMT)-like permease